MQEEFYDESGMININNGDKTIDEVISVIESRCKLILEERE